MALNDSKAPRVFLSHSGVQKGFVEQLDSDLRQRDRYPFFDKDRDSLRIGESFPPFIFQAIQQCQVGVVILSEDFFSSKWPMLELVEMVQTTEDKPKQMKIMPIFLSVSCADLGDEKKLSDWKAKWCVLAESDNRINISDWEKALRVLKLTNGLVFNTRVGELKFREEIVKEICKIVPPFHRWDDSHVQGKITQIIHKKIEETPISTSHKVQVVGLYGVGGIGKTTACKLLCNDFEKEFDGRVCHIEFGHGTEMDLLRKTLKELTKTTHELLKELTIDECWARLTNIMRSERVFLAIDNVSSNSKIIDEARRYLKAGCGRGSTMVVAARSLEELENLWIDTSACLPMPELEEDDAKALFLYHIPPTNEVDDKILMHCIQRCYFCKGDDRSHHYHPLALEVLGKQLGPSDPEEWELQLKEVDTFNQLREPENPVFSILRRSFDALLPEDKVLFMDVAIFHSKAIMPQARTMRLNCGVREIYSDFDLEGGAYWNIFEWLGVVHGLSGDAVKRRLNNLKRKSLLEELGDGISRIGIHDLWWEFALIETKVGEIESRRWVHEIEDGEDEGFSLDPSLFDEGEDTSLSGDGEGEESRLFDDIGECEDSSLLGDGEGEESRLSGDEESNEGEGSSLSDDDGESEGEVVESSLSGGGWENLQRISVIGKALSLEKRVKSINFTYCSKVTVLRLTNVNVENRELDLSGLKQMKICEIVCSYDFYSNPFDKVSGIGQATNLRVFIWMNIGIESTSAVERISCLTNLQVLQLYFIEREDLQSSHHCRDLTLDLGRLRLLRVARVRFVQFEGKFTVSGLSSKMTKLRVLDLTGCCSMRNCPDVSNIIGLEVLVLSDCRSLEDLPNLRRLKNLLILDIENCESLRAVAGLGSLVALQKLRAEACYELHVLPDVSKLTNLQVLDVKDCDSLKCIPGMSNLIALQKFIASTDGKFLEDLPDCGTLTKLVKAEIYGPHDAYKWDIEPIQWVEECSKEDDECSEEDDEFSEEEDEFSQEDDQFSEKDDKSSEDTTVSSKEDTIVCSKEDTVLASEDVESIQRDDETNLLESRPILNLAILEYVLKLALRGTNHELTNLSRLTRLEDLEITSCGFKTLPGLSNLTAMKKLQLHDCSLERLPDMGKHMKLEFLKIRSCKSLRGWDGVGRLRSSESQSSVDLQCDWTLSHLEMFQFSSSAFIELPDLSHFPRLRVLKIEGRAHDHCSSIPDFALHCLTDHLQLEILHCIDWPIMELPDLSKFPSLRELKVGGCNNLTSLTSSGPVIALEDLRLGRCKSLEVLPDVCLIPGLKYFCISKCGVMLNAQEFENLLPRCRYLRVDKVSWKFGQLRMPR